MTLKVGDEVVLIGEYRYQGNPFPHLRERITESLGTITKVYGYGPVAEVRWDVPLLETEQVSWLVDLECVRLMEPTDAEVEAAVTSILSSRVASRLRRDAHTGDAYFHE